LVAKFIEMIHLYVLPLYITDLLIMIEEELLL